MIKQEEKILEKECCECGAVFKVARRRAERGRGVYCSRRCAGLGKARDQRMRKMTSPQGGEQAQTLLPCLGNKANSFYDVDTFKRDESKGNTAGLGELGSVKDVGGRQGEPCHHSKEKVANRVKTIKPRSGKRDLQQSFSLDLCPWRTGAVSPTCCDGEYYAVPDVGWGF